MAADFDLPSDCLCLVSESEDLPSPPNNVQLVDVKTNSVKIKWESPISDVSSPILNFKIYTYSNGVGIDTVLVNGTENQFLHEGLSRGTAYTFVITTLSAEGESPPSNELEISTLTPITIQLLQNKIETFVGVKVLTISPIIASGGAGTLTYSIIPDLPAGMSFDPSNGEISGIPSAPSELTTYTITVIDESLPTPQTVSDVFDLVVNATPPDIPTDVIAVSLGKGNKARLFWSSPTSNTPLQGFIVRYSTSESGPWSVYENGTSNVNFAEISDLKKNTTYYFQVAAINQYGGQGHFSPSVSCTTQKKFVDVYVSTHNDDDLIFVGTDISKSIREGNEVVTIYITAGNGGLRPYKTYNPSTGDFVPHPNADNMGYIQGRVLGTKWGYAGLSAFANSRREWMNSWIDQQPTEKSNTRFYVKSQSSLIPRTTLYFFGLPNSNSLYSASYTWIPTGEIGPVWTGNNDDLATLNTVGFQRMVDSDCSFQGKFDTVYSVAPSLTKGQIVNALGVLLNDIQPDRITIPDHTRIYSYYNQLIGDHPAHHVAGSISLAGVEKYQSMGNAAPELRTYRGYNTVFDNSDFKSGLTDPDFLNCLKSMYNYNEVDAGWDLGPYPGFLPGSNYIWRRAKDIAMKQTSCMKIVNVKSGMALKSDGILAFCPDMPVESTFLWSLDTLGRLINMASGLCLTVDGNRLRMQLPDEYGKNINQVWHLFEYGCQSSQATYGPIYSYGGQMKSGLSRSLIYANGDLTMVESSQLTNNDGSAAWIFEPSNIHIISSALSNENISIADPTKYESARFGDLLGRGIKDLCFRKSDGLYCQLNNGDGTFSSNVLKISSEFSDKHDWNLIQYAKTIQFADVNGDNKTDICGFNHGKVTCWLNITDNDTLPKFSSQGIDIEHINDDDMLRDEAYRTLLFLPLRGKDYPADLCYCSEKGLACAQNTTPKGSFNISFDNFKVLSNFNATNAIFPYYSSYSSKESTFNGPDKAGTMTFGDIDGDGKPDVCSRSTAGIICVLNTSSNDQIAFSSTARIWTQLNQLTDNYFDAVNNQSVFHTIHLADVNADGKADLCVRLSNGINCAYSVGDGFGPLNPINHKIFTDELGWDNIASAQTFVTSDYDANGTTYLCMRGNDGLYSQSFGSSLSTEVRYSTNGGNGSIPDTQKINIGQSIKTHSHGNLTKHGYEFQGWNTASNGKGIDVGEEVDYFPPISLTLFAKWKIIPDTVFFHTNGGSPVDYQIVNFQKQATEPISTFAGHSLDNWYLDEEFTMPFDFSSYIDKNTHLYARWSKRHYTVSFYVNGAYESFDDQDVEYDQLAARPPDPTKEGAVFEGWFTDENHTQLYDFSSPVTNNLTLYARWSSVVTSTQDANRVESVLLYPNPTKQFLNIKFSQSFGSFAEFYLYSLTGKLLYQKSILKLNHQIDFSSFTRATYLIKIKTATTVQWFTIIKI